MTGNERHVPIGRLPDVSIPALRAFSRRFLELEFRDSLTEMDSRFRGNDGQPESNVSR